MAADGIADEPESAWVGRRGGLAAGSNSAQGGRVQRVARLVRVIWLQKTLPGLRSETHRFTLVETDRFLIVWRES
ncbi:hypothetical protein ABZT02_36630 [Streptomyces sp. NPDC005402]|uniref:hypothetical protein n=1 Tax=Streptomyces sp. NPDC005402 TaxID=3155338 RepID=UPI0033A72030